MVLTQDIKCNGVMNTAIQCLILGLTRVADAVQVGRDVEGELDGGDGAAVQSGRPRGVRGALDEDALAPPRQHGGRVARARVAGERRPLARLQRRRLLGDAHVVRGEEHAQGDGLDQGDLRGCVGRLALVPSAVVRHVRHERQFRCYGLVAHLHH